VVHADGYEACRWASGERHERAVSVDGGTVTIADRVHGEGAEAVFPLAPGAVATLAGARAEVTSGGSRAAFHGEGLGPWRLEPAEHAPRFSQRVAALRLVAPLHGAAARTRIETGPAR
jgi:hypothetical protein